MPLDTWKDYLAFHFINSYAQYLPRAFDEAKFDFFSRTLGGAAAAARALEARRQLLNGSMGEAVGRIYVERHFPAESRRQMDELIGNLRAAFAERLRSLDWMDDATAAQALAKLDAFEPRIGHPIEWIDYSTYRGRTAATCSATCVRAARVRLEPAAVAPAQSGRPARCGA